MNTTANITTNLTVTANSVAINKSQVIKRIATILGIAVAAFILLFATSAFLAMQVWNGLDAGQSAPSFSGHDLNGNPMSLDAYQGKPVMLTFWSPDCGACREELPTLQAIASDPNADVTLLTIVSKVPTAEVAQFVAEAGLTFPILVDEPGNIAKAYEITGVPISYFINPDGKIDHSIIGAGSKDTLRNDLFTWLGTCNLEEVCK
jgi:peroxiredoxin